MACRPSCGITVDRMESSGKTITFPGRFLFPKTALPENRILGAPFGTVWIGWRDNLPERMKARQRGQRIVFRGESRPARRPVMMAGRGESISSAGVFGNCFRLSSPTFDPMPLSNALRPCLDQAVGETPLPFFGNHPISSGFLRRISSRATMAIPTTEKDRDKPSSHFRHIYSSVCTSYAAVCSPYALFRLEQEARRE